MSEEENKQPQIIMGGVSGNKELRVRRVHKKKADEMEADITPATENVETESVKKAKPSTSVSDASNEPKDEGKTEAVKAHKENKVVPSDSKPEIKPNEATATKDSAPQKGQDKIAPAAVNSEASFKVSEKKADANQESGTARKDEIKKPYPPKNIHTNAPSSTNNNPQRRPNYNNDNARQDGAATRRPVQPDRTKISSAVISMPTSTVKSSTVIPGNRDRRPPFNRDGNRPYNNNNGGSGNGYQSNNSGSGYNNNGGYRPNRNNNVGGPSSGPRNFGGGGGFAKDKDSDDSSNRPPMKRAPKPKAEGGFEVEIKTSRANFAERNSVEKKKTEGDSTKKNTSKNPIAANKNRNKNDISIPSFNGRVSDVLNDDSIFDSYQGYGRRKKKIKSSYIAAPVVEKKITNVKIPAFITVKELAEGIEKKSSDVIKELLKLGMLVTINQELDFDTACLVADAYGIKAELMEEVTEEDILFDDGDDKDENLKQRPPVVVVMGHVDHGKTSLLDRIRSASVVSGEAGGITQHIGAYTVRLKGRQITFLDTPGHEAFTTMRARGAQVTDIAILVVAADDGVMPQTVEAINHAKAAGTEIIVAINKIDKPGANPEKVKQELTNYELVPEEWGGSTIMVPVSAKKGEGIDDLLEMVLLTADVLELKADPKRQAKGAVIEAKLDKNRGPVATVLVQRGTLRQGDTVVCGAMIGNIRAMYDDKGADIKKAGPSVPVEILGLPEVPEAGEHLYAVTDDKIARQLVEKRRIKQREEQLRKSSRMSLETLAASMAAGEIKNLNLIIKADVQGSVEAVIQSLEKISNEEVKVKVIHGGVGAINESDVVLADVSNAIIIGFNVRPSALIAEKAKEVGVDIRLYSVIYNAIEDVESAMKGMLAPKFEEEVLGHVEIREIFKVSAIGTIGGAYVQDGKIVRNCDVRLVRNGIVVYTGHLASLQRMKDSVKEVNAGYECGLSIENYNDLKIGDIIESFQMKEVER